MNKLANTYVVKNHKQMVGRVIARVMDTVDGEVLKPLSDSAVVVPSQLAKKTSTNR